MNKVTMNKAERFKSATLTYGGKLYNDAIVEISYTDTVVIDEPHLVRDRGNGLFEYKGMVGIIKENSND